MKKLVFNALAFKEGFSTSMQIKNSLNKQETYLKNSFVSLKSSLIQNPDVDAILFVNEDIPLKYKEKFEDNGIKVHKIEFSEFILPKEFNWSLAFFKLEALKYAVQNLAYEKYLMLDTDTFVVNQLEDLWIECNNGILLYDVDHKVSHPHRKEIYENMHKYTKNNRLINHYGGEFIAGNRDKMIELVQNLYEEYNQMYLNKDILDKSLGDEYLLSIVADRMKESIIRGNKYIYRYWTSKFYLVSTNYKFNAVDIWHIPQEKEFGMIKLYNYFIKNNKFPPKNKISKMMGFPSYIPPLGKIIKKLIKKISYFKL